MTRTDSLTMLALCVAMSDPDIASQMQLTGKWATYLSAVVRLQVNDYGNLSGLKHADQKLVAEWLAHHFGVGWVPSQQRVAEAVLDAVNLQHKAERGRLWAIQEFGSSSALRPPGKTPRELVEHYERLGFTDPVRDPDAD